jgi:predicted dehydrogenase
MRFLIVGFGSIGRRHFRNLLKLGEKDIIFLRSHHSTLEATELEGYLVETDIETALSHDPDGVIVANPTAFHLDTAIPAAKQGRHILMEKPVSHSLQRVEEFSHIVQESGARVLMGFQFRYHPNLIQIKDLLDAGRIGEVVYFRSHWGEYLPDWHPWEDYRQGYAARKDLGGGVLRTLCHTFDYLGWLFGEGKVNSTQLSTKGLGLDVEDTAEIGMAYPEGVIGSLHLNFTERPPKHILEIIGSNGSIHWDYYKNVVEVFEYQPDGKLVDSRLFCPEGFDRNDLFLAEMKHFIEVIRDNQPPICPLEDGIKVLELIIEAEKRGKT